MPRYKYRHQPRIQNVTRIRDNSALLPEIEEGLKEIARTENKSKSWVIAEIVSAYFGVDVIGNKLRFQNKKKA